MRESDSVGIEATWVSSSRGSENRVDEKSSIEVAMGSLLSVDEDVDRICVLISKVLAMASGGGVGVTAVLNAD